MKKNEVKKLTEVKKLKKLRLSRETLQTLTGSDVQKVVGGNEPMSPLCSPNTQSEEVCPTE